MDDEANKSNEELKQQMNALLSAAETQSAQVKQAREQFETVRDRIMSGMNFPDEQFREGFRVTLENLYTYGHTAGSACETALAIREQLDLLTKMNDGIDARNKANDERAIAEEKARTERDERALEYQRQQLAALEKQDKARAERDERALEYQRCQVRVLEELTLVLKGPH
jgi:hypothetical protein